MHPRELSFVIPTYRLRDVGETVEQYDEHFWRNGHSVTDDRLRRFQPRHAGEVLPAARADPHPQRRVLRRAAREGAVPRATSISRLRDKRLESLVKNLFRPSYGGNRNYTLMYTLGGLMVSADDDMRPFAFDGGQPRVARRRRGEPRQAAQGGPERLHAQVVRHRSPRFSTCSASAPRDVPENYERGELLVDTAMDLETNATQGAGARELADAAARPGARRRGGEDGPDVPLGHRTTSTPSTTSTCSWTTRSRRAWTT